MGGTNIKIMWKEIVIILLILYSVRLAIDIYIKIIYNKIIEKFYTYNWDGLEEKVEKHRKICNVFSNGRWNKNVRLIYNGLCVVISSMAFLRGDDSEFINQLSCVKDEVNFEIKPFMLALYYRSRNDEVAMREYYNKFLDCNSHSEYTKVIMEKLFSEQMLQKSENLHNAIKKFQNPGIIKLLQENGLIDKKTEE